MKINSCFVFALLLLLVSYSLALDKLQTDEKVKGAVDKVEPAGGGGGGGGNWGGGGGGGNWGGGGGGGCHHGCCYKGSYGCQKCCSSPEEAKAVAEKSQPQTTNEKTGDTDKVEPAGGGGGSGNWGGGGGGGGHGGGGYGCQHGCCYKGHYNNCNKCCSSPEEAKAVAEKEADVQNTQPEAKVEGVADKVKPAGGGGGNWGGGGGGNWGGGGGGHGGGGGNWGGGGGGHGGGGGGGCQHGCCYGGRGYGCQRCCSSPEEAKAVAAKQAHP